MFPANTGLPSLYKAYDPTGDSKTTLTLIEKFFGSLQEKLGFERSMLEEHWISVLTTTEVWIGIGNGAHKISSHGRLAGASGEIISAYELNGYEGINVRANGVVCRALVHRLVAECFIPNPLGLPFVNHKDGNKKNNRVDNLEWCDASSNAIHAARVLGKKKRTRPVLQLSFAGELIKRWEGVQSAADEMKLSYHAVRESANNQSKTGGFLWRWDVETDHNTDISSFRDIEHYPNYMVSPLGEIWSRLQLKLMKLHKSDNGRMYVKIVNQLANGDRKRKSLQVSRVVAEAFIPNPNNFPVVNHINGDPSDNRVENLEWTTHSGNNQHAVEIGAVISRPVTQYDLQGNVIANFKSVRKAVQNVPGTDDKCIYRCLQNGNFTHMGYRWGCTGELLSISKHPVAKYDRDDQLVSTYDSVEEALADLENANRSSLLRCLKGERQSYLGFHWKYIGENISQDH